MEVEIDLREGPIPVAVAGLGAIGRQHARLLSELPQFRLVGACDADPANRAESSERLGIPVVASYEELTQLAPKAVVIALPTSLHHESAKFFIDKGIHLLVEKPVASTPEQAAELAKLADAAGITLLVGHVERFNAAVRAMKAEIDSGRLGDIISVVTRRVGIARPAVPHANVALDLAIHDVDILRYMLGVPGELVACGSSTIGGNRLEDHVDMVLRYGQTFCTVQANWITPVKIRRMSVTGSKGTAELDYITQKLQIYETAPQLIKGDEWDFFAVSAVSPVVEIPVEKSEPLRAELQHFADCVTNGVAPLVPVDQAADALQLVHAAGENQPVHV